MNFERLYLLREEKELKQNELASILNVKQVNISNWENNKEIIPLNKLNAYSNYFNINLDYIAKLSDNKTSTKKINLDKKTIGNNLKALRKEFNITQEELASLLNTSHSTISAYETGKTLILTAFAFQICQKYNVSLDWLVGKNSDQYLNKKTTE